MRKILIAATAALGMTASAPANAWYRPYYGYRYDPGPAIALGIFGAIAGAAIASQGYAYAPPYPYDPAYAPVYAAPVYGCPLVPVYAADGAFAGYKHRCY